MICRGVTTSCKKKLLGYPKDHLTGEVDAGEQLPYIPDFVGIVLTKDRGIEIICPPPSDFLIFRCLCNINNYLYSVNAG